MNGIGHTQYLSNAGSSIQTGLLIRKGAGDLEVVIEAGLATFDQGLVVVERKSNDASLTASATAGTYNVYVNHPDAVTEAAAALADFSVGTAASASEGAQSRTNIHGGNDRKEGRSILLGTVTVAGGVITSWSNAPRLKAFAAAPTLAIHK